MRFPERGLLLFSQVPSGQERVAGQKAAFNQAAGMVETNGRQLEPLLSGEEERRPAQRMAAASQEQACGVGRIARTVLGLSRVAGSTAAQDEQSAVIRRTMVDETVALGGVVDEIERLVGRV